MKKKNSILIILINFLAFLFNACGMTEPAVETSKITSTGSLQNNEASLSDRVTIKNQKLTIKDSLGLTTQNEEYHLVLVGEASAPVHEGKTLQATDVYTNGTYAVVSYNLSGASKKGGLEVFDISDEENPKAISQLLFSDIDFNSIAMDNRTVLATGANSSDSPSFVHKYKMDSEFKFDQGPTSESSLSSFAGNDVAISKKHIAVTSGSAGGIHFFKRSNFSPLGFSSLPVARSIAFDNTGKPWVLQGLPGKVSAFDTNGTLQNGSVYEIGGASIAESKSTLTIGKELGVAAVNDGGVKVFCKADGGVIARIATEVVDGLDASLTVANAATIHEGLLFVANGEAGVALHSVTKENEKTGKCHNRTIQKHGSIAFGNSLSANHVVFKMPYLFVADGLGGLKIIYVQRLIAYEDDDDDFDDDGDDATDELVGLCHKNRFELRIPKSAVPAHIRHGDTEGTCETPKKIIKEKREKKGRL